LRSLSRACLCVRGRTCTRLKAGQTAPPPRKLAPRGARGAPTPSRSVS
jgi:hypothetical protein